MRLLKLRYAIADFQEIPDRHRGDYGIEGFSRDGRAYQCYSPTEPLTTNARYEAQRDKMSADIKKFVDNQDALTKVLGTTAISRWVFAVPTFDSGPLVQHGEKKAAEVRALRRSYVAPDFCIAIVTEEDFEPERARLLRLGLDQVALQAKPIDPAASASWATAHSPLLAVLTTKLSRLPGGATTSGPLQHRLIGHYLQGQEVLDMLKAEHAELFEVALRTKAGRESFLETHCLITPDSPQKLLAATLQEFKRELMRFEVMTEQMAEALAYEAVADWLMRCPLDFPQEA
ncbi:MAG: hypothetical protein JNL21_12425 [Myxococcales bacterium]|nr:hypothetical protein [Myxococcales bacterium]